MAIVSPEQPIELINPPIEHIVVLNNPVSKNGHRGRRQLQDLINFSELPFNTIPTDRDRDVTADRLSLLEPTDMLYIIGGDGTVNQALSSALKGQPLVLPTRSGNANDLAMSMNGRIAPWQVFSDYKTGKAHGVPVRPIQVSVHDGHERQTRCAINYASFGYAALASHYINQPWEHPRLKKVFDMLPSQVQSMARLPREAFLLAKAAHDASVFDYSEQGDGTILFAVDISAIHSDRMAKVGRIDVQHSDDFMFASALSEAGVGALSKEFIRMVRAKMVGENVASRAFHISNSGGHDLYYQLDGEAFPLTLPSDVNISLGDTPLRILSTKL